MNMEDIKKVMEKVQDIHDQMEKQAEVINKLMEPVRKNMKLPRHAGHPFFANSPALA